MALAYVAGPMRNRFHLNFPAFDAARDWLIEAGWKVISPADLDRKAWGQPAYWKPSEFASKTLSEDPVVECFKRDLVALTTADAIVLLPDWDHSVGARLERSAAEAMGLSVYYLDVEEDHFEEVGAVGAAYAEALSSVKDRTLTPATDAPTTILDEAKALITGARQEAYGPAIQDFSRTAQIVSALLGIEIRPEQIPLIMIAVKLSREVHRPKRDNLRDLCGYAGTYEMVRNEIGGW